MPTSPVQSTFAPSTAIVTGADSGIGRATAVALAEAGMDVGVTWHEDEAGAKATADEVRSTGRHAVVAQLDTTDLAGCGEAIDRLAVDGAFVCIQRAARRMVAAGRGGRIVAITSVHDHQPRVGSSAYDAAKHGLGHLQTDEWRHA